MVDNIDVNFFYTPPPPAPHAQLPAAAAAAAAHPYHNRHQVLQKYTTALRQLRNLAEQSYNVRTFHFDNYLLLQYFFQQQQHAGAGGGTDVGVDAPSVVAPAPRTTAALAFLKVELLKHILDRRRQILYWLFYLALVSLCVFVYRNEGTVERLSAVAERSVSFVYPGMRMWRRMTLPLIEQFPQLTELYDESCLMENPFFQVDDLSCEPCAHVQSVLDLTDTATGDGDNDSDGKAINETPSEFVPFVFKINQTPIELDDFYAIYARNHEIFQRDAFRVQSTNSEVSNLDQLFSQFNDTQRGGRSSFGAAGGGRRQPAQAHHLWRCNRMLPARLLRQLFARPAPRLPSTGIALERFMAIDTPQAPAYTLPDTECANVHVQQARGTRFIILRPTSECRHRCRTLSMRLPQSFVLSYNWWYWKPISAPDPVSDTLSISFIGSYC